MQRCMDRLHLVYALQALGPPLLARCIAIIAPSRGFGYRGGLQLEALTSLYPF